MNIDEYNFNVLHELFVGPPRPDKGELNRLNQAKLIEWELSRGYDRREKEAVRSDYLGYDKW